MTLKRSVILVLTVTKNMNFYNEWGGPFLFFYDINLKNDGVIAILWLSTICG